MGTIDSRIIEEIKRYKSINKYVLEQAVPGTDEPAPALPPAGAETTPAPGGAMPELGADVPAGPAESTPEFVDTNADSDVEKLGANGESETKSTDESGTEEMDITDLVSAQKDTLQKQDDYFTQLFQQLETLESKLGEMDVLMSKVNSLETKLEKYRPKTPQEKLELRSLDSGPYNQKLSDFFVDKEQQMEKSGKNEYVLTSDDVENYSASDIRDTFNIENPKKNFGI